MKLLLVSIKDRALDAFLPVQTVRAEGEAVRGFQDMVNDPNNKQLYAHADDYDLYVVGAFEDTTAIIQQPNPVYVIARGKDLKMREPS